MIVFEALFIGGSVSQRFLMMEPGVFTTIQDLGRKGYFASGIRHRANALDRFA
jgi:hypothetical protein